ncbi:MAG TPA: YhfZ family protein [Candidatus Dormibacteraeota bacterium]|nr:YhfZ family protein [Candidatus Dormibacteraeota bacterium]
MFETSERRRAPAAADIVPTLARQFLAELDVGSRLPTVRALAREHHSSNSSVHAAISKLEQGGAISIETRGRAGAFLVQRSIDRLWAMTKAGPLVIALPLASSPRYEALATAIKQMMTNGGLDVILMFVRGSRQRLQAVHEGRCHLAAMSSFAASELCDSGDAIVTEMLPNSYNTGHRVFYTPGGNNAHPVRVVVDRHSADQQLLTALEFVDREVVTLPAMTGQIARLLESGQPDAAVWTIDEMQTRWPAGVLDRPLSPAVRERIGDRDTRAVLVGKSVDASVLRAVCAALDAEQIERIQQDVIAGRTVPEY